MSVNANITQICKCEEFEKKIISLLKENGNLLEMIRDQRRENEQLQNESSRLRSRLVSASESGAVGTGTNEKNSEIESLIGINHVWKRDYEDLQMRHEMLSGEKRLLEEEEKELKERINYLEKRQGPLESEITRLATALYKQNQEGVPGSNDEQCEILKTQISVYKEDVERERRDRESSRGEREIEKRARRSGGNYTKVNS